MIRNITPQKNAKSIVQSLIERTKRKVLMVMVMERMSATRKMDAWLKKKEVVIVLGTVRMVSPLRET